MQELQYILSNICIEYMLYSTVLVVSDCIIDQHNVLPVAVEADWLVNVGEVLDTGVHRHHLPAHASHRHREHADVGTKVWIICLELKWWNSTTLSTQERGWGELEHGEEDATDGVLLSAARPADVLGYSRVLAQRLDADLPWLTLSNNENLIILYLPSPFFTHLILTHSGESII